MKLNITSTAVALLRLSTLALAAPTAPVSATLNTTAPTVSVSTALNTTVPTAPVSAVPNTTAQQQAIITPTTGHVNLGEEVPPGRQREEQADQYLFNMTLDSFMSHRDQRYPSYFWWESDGCSQSPDAPFGFPFLPACYRHDFGYDQYKQQDRYTPAAKDKLDRNFRSDLYHICSAPDLKNEICEACAEDPHRKDIDCKHTTDMCKFPQEDVCKCLADIYYSAVKKFGRKQKRRQKRGLGGFDITQLALCLDKNLHSENDEPVD